MNTIIVPLQVSWNMDKPKINNDEYIIVYKKENDETSTGKVNVTFQQKSVLLYNLGRLVSLSIVR